MDANVIGGPGHAIPLTAVLNANLTNVICVTTARILSNVCPSSMVTTSNTPFTVDTSAVLNG